MPVTCIVMNCRSRADRDRISFYSIPAPLKNRLYKPLKQLSRKRREEWLTAIGRSDLTETKIKYQRVCARHFVRGKPSDLEDPTNIDWVPSQHMGHVALTIKSEIWIKEEKVE